MREEIESGLKNAVERGDSLDEAVNSFINAGYNPVEVKEAAKNVSLGASSITNVPPVQSQEKSMFDEKKPFQKTPPIDNIEQIGNKFESAPKMLSEKKENPQISPKQDITRAAPKKNNTKTIVLIALVVLIFILLVFLVGVVIFKEKLISLLSG